MRGVICGYIKLEHCNHGLVFLFTNKYLLNSVNNCCPEILLDFNINQVNSIDNRNILTFFQKL